MADSVFLVVDRRYSEGCTKTTPPRGFSRYPRPLRTLDRLAQRSSGKSSRVPGPFWTENGRIGGADGVRTHDLLDAIEARSQLRHGPTELFQFTTGRFFSSSSLSSRCLHATPGPLYKSYSMSPNSLHDSSAKNEQQHEIHEIRSLLVTKRSSFNLRPGPERMRVGPRSSRARAATRPATSANLFRFFRLSLDGKHSRLSFHHSLHYPH